MAQSVFQSLLDAVNQAEHDQSLFESELASSELQGLNHEEIVQLGSELIKAVKEFANMGSFFAEQQNHGFIPRLVRALEDYEALMMPPKVFGGLCPCLKPARSGPEYERKYLLARSQMVVALLLAQSVVIEGKGEKLNMESMRFADYSNKMNNLFNTLASISTKGNEQAREAARNELHAALELVNRFLKSYEDETESLRAESKRRIATTVELLESRSQTDGIPLSRRILVKCQSTLQEIMNSAAAVSLNKCREAMSELEDLTSALKECRAKQVAALVQMESQMDALGLSDDLLKLREVADMFHSDAASKLRDALKRWGTVKAQSSQRPVAEYTEETVASVASVASVAGAGLASTAAMADPQKLFDHTGKSISSLGKSFTQLPKKAGKGGASAVLAAVKFTANRVDEARSAVDGAVDGAMTGAKKALRIDEAPTAATPVKPSRPSGALANVGKMFDM